MQIWEEKLGYFFSMITAHFFELDGQMDMETLWDNVMLSSDTIHCRKIIWKKKTNKYTKKTTTTTINGNVLWEMNRICEMTLTFNLNHFGQMNN